MNSNNQNQINSNPAHNNNNNNRYQNNQKSHYNKNYNQQINQQVQPQMGFNNSNYNQQLQFMNYMMNPQFMANPMQNQGGMRNNFQNPMMMNQQMRQTNDYSLTFQGVKGQERQVIQLLQSKFKFQFEFKGSQKQTHKDKNGERELLKFNYILKFQDKKVGQQCMYANHLKLIKLEENTQKPKLIFRKVFANSNVEGKIKENNVVTFKVLETERIDPRSVFVYCSLFGIVYRIEKSKEDFLYFEVQYQFNDSAVRFLQHRDENDQITGVIRAYQKETPIKIQITGQSSCLDNVERLSPEQIQKQKQEQAAQKNQQQQQKQQQQEQQEQQQPQQQQAQQQQQPQQQQGQQQQAQEQQQKF